MKKIINNNIIHNNSSYGNHICHNYRLFIIIIVFLNKHKKNHQNREGVPEIPVRWIAADQLNRCTRQAFITLNIDHHHHYHNELIR